MKRRNVHHMCEKITEPLSAKAKQYSEAEMKRLKMSLRICHMEIKAARTELKQGKLIFGKDFIFPNFFQLHYL
jgi:hypothetical protein